MTKYFGVGLAPVLDMSEQEREGSISLEQFSLCRDHSVDAIRHASEVDTIGLAVRKELLSGVPVNMALILHRIRTRSGMSAPCAKKTQMGVVEEIGSRLDHYVTMTSLAPTLAWALNASLLDVDSKYDDEMPSPSDITLMGREAAPNGKPIVYLIDVTSSGIGMCQQKILDLESDSKLKFASLPINVVCMVLSIDTAQWRGDVVLPKLSLKGLHADKTPRDSALEMIAEWITSSSPEEVRSLNTALHEKLDPVMDQLMDEIMAKSQTPRGMETEIKELIMEMSANGREVEKELLKFVEAHDKSMFSFLGEAESLARDMGLKEAEKLVSCWRKGVTHSMDREVMRRAPPIPLQIGSKLGSGASELAKHDLMFMIVQEALSAEGEDRTTFTNGMAYGTDLKKRPIMLADKVDFSRAQTEKTHFYHKIVAYVRRPCIGRAQVMMSNGTKDIPLSKQETMSYQEKPNTIPSGFIITTKHVKEYAPFVQIMMNPEYYTDPSFLRFIRRKSTNMPKEHAELPAEVSVEDAIGIMNKYEDLVDDCVLSPAEFSYSKKVATSFMGKMDFVFSARSPPQVAAAFTNTRMITDNKLEMLVDAEAAICRALSGTLHSRLQPNTVTLLNSSSHGILALAFINSPAEHFRSCNVKTLSLSSIRVDADFRRTPLISMRDGVSVKHSAVYLTESLLSDGGQLHITASPFDTWDRQHIEWIMELPAKMAVRAASLVHSRPTLATSEGSWGGWDNVGESSGPDFMSREVITNMTGFMSARQQNTISMQAQRYLHQSLGGLETDYLATPSKIVGIRLRTSAESAPHLKMLGVYVCGVLAKVSNRKGKEVLRGANLETFTVMPHLLRASNDPLINTSAYFSYLQYNNEKQWRTPYEALDVLALWKQMDSLNEAKMSDPELLDGFTTKDISLILNIPETNTRGVSKISVLTSVLSSGLSDAGQLMRRIGAKRLEQEKTLPYQGCNWFELMCYLDVRLEVGTLGSPDDLIGQDLSEFFTMRGSIDEREFSPMADVRSYRKASAMVNTAARLIEVGDKATYPAAFAQAVMVNPSLYLDQMSLILGRYAGLLPAEPLIQESDKNQAGKAREISTLNVGYGLICLLTEKLSMQLSAAIPEDMITNNYKIGEIDRTVKNSQYRKNMVEGIELVYLNQDKSNFGPNKRSGSMLSMACALSSSMNGYYIFQDAILTSTKKKVRYPHGLIKEALGTVVTYDETSRTKSAHSTTMARWHPFNEATSTGKILAEVSRQFHSGSRYGPAGTSWAEVGEGMPGQGIMGVSSSIAHAAILRYMKKLVKRKLGWDLDAIVTSDDSMCTITLQSQAKGLMVQSARRIFALVAAMAGLIENEGKFVMTLHKPEMNTIYYQGPEIIPPYWKFMNAATTLHTGANLSEDLIHAANKGNDAVKEGASFLDGALVAVANMVMCIDTHRAWTLYLASAQHYIKNISAGMDEALARRMCIVFAPPEVLGIPSVDPATSILSPMGVRTSAAFNSTLRRECSLQYCKSIALNSLRQPEGDFKLAATDSDELFVGLNSMNTATSLSLGAAPVSTLPTSSWPSMNGIRGMLRRRKGTLRLANELGPVLLGSKPRMLASTDTTQMGTLLSVMMSNLRGPIEKGDAESSPLLLSSDLAHCRTRRSLYVTPGTPVALALKPGWIAPKDLYLAMSKPENTVLALEAFESLVMNLTPPMDANEIWKGPIFEFLSKEAEFSLDFARVVSPSVIKKDNTSAIYAEHIKEVKGRRTNMYRLLGMSSSLKRGIDEKRILGGCLASCLTPSEYEKLPQDLKRVMAGHAPYGTMGVDDAIMSSSAMLNRIKSSLPSNFYVIGNTSTTAIDEEMAREDWIRHSFTRGTTCALPYLPRRDEYEFSSLSLHMDADTSVKVKRILSEEVMKSLKRCLVDGSIQSAPKIGSKKMQVNSISDYEVGLTMPRPVIRRLAPLMGSKEASLMASVSKAVVLLSMESIVKVLRVSARLGWCGTSMYRCRLRGPFKTFVRNGEVGRYIGFFLSTAVSYDQLAAGLSEKYMHSAWILDSVPADSKDISECNLVSGKVIAAISRSRIGAMHQVDEKDTVTNIVVDASMKLNASLYGTACLLSIRADHTGRHTDKAFPFSVITFSISPEIMSTFESDVWSLPRADIVSLADTPYNLFHMLRHPIKDLAGSEAFPTGVKLGEAMRERLTLTDNLIMTSHLVVSIARGGIPPKRLKKHLAAGRDEEETLNVEEEERYEGDWGESSSTSTPSIDLMEMLKDRVRRRAEDTATEERRIMEIHEIADIIESMDMNQNVEDIALVSKLSALSLREAKSMAKSMSEGSTLCQNQNMALMLGMIWAMTDIEEEVKVGEMNLVFPRDMDEEMWEDMEPAKQMEVRGGVFGKGRSGMPALLATSDAWNLALHMDNIGVESGASRQGLLGAGMRPQDTDMDKVMDELGLPNESSAVNVSDLVRQMRELGIEMEDVFEED
jgi:hypothetical protein